MLKTPPISVVHGFIKRRLPQLIRNAVRKRARELRKQERSEAAEFLESLETVGAPPVPLTYPDGEEMTKQPDWGFASKRTGCQITVVGLISFSQKWEDAMEEAWEYLTAKGNRVQQVILLDIPYGGLGTAYVNPRAHPTGHLGPISRRAKYRYPAGAGIVFLVSSGMSSFSNIGECV